VVNLLINENFQVLPEKTKFFLTKFDKEHILHSYKSAIVVLMESYLNKKVTIKIPDVIYQRIRNLIDGSGFNSPTDFIVYVLRDLVGEKEIGKEKEELTTDELQAIKRKLKNLGYL